MTGHCKDCRYWEFHHDTRGRKWHTCEAANWVNRDDQIDDSDIAYYADALDDSGLDAGIKTGPMFGCVKFMK